MAAIARVEPALAAFRAGEVVLLTDDRAGEERGVLVSAAEHAGPESLAFTVRYSSGFICVALPADRADHLDLPAQPQDVRDTLGAAFAVTVDVTHGTTTGISAADRARTVRALADPAATARDFTRPGHVVPVRALPEGLGERLGVAEAAVELTRLAGSRPAAVLAEIVSETDPTGMARFAELIAFARRHDLRHVTISDIYRCFLQRWHRVEPGHPVPMLIDAADFTAVDYRQPSTGAVHVAFLRGEPCDGVTVSVHAECLPGMVLRQRGCGCARRLAGALAAAAGEPAGLVVYLRTGGRRCPRPGAPERTRLASWLTAGVLRDLGIGTVRLRAGSAGDAAMLAEYGISVETGTAQGAGRSRGGRPS